MTNTAATNAITVTRHYQLGAESTFDVSDKAGLMRAIHRTARQMRDGGDLQGVWYSVASPDDARALGCYETVEGQWVVEDHGAVLDIE